MEKDIFKKEYNLIQDDQEKGNLNGSTNVYKKIYDLTDEEQKNRVNPSK